ILAQRVQQFDHFERNFFFCAAGRLLPLERDEKPRSVRAHPNQVGAMFSAARLAADDDLLFNRVTVVEQDGFNAGLERGPGLRADAARKKHYTFRVASISRASSRLPSQLIRRG